MAVIQLAPAGTGPGTTDGVPVPESRNYTIHVVWDGTGTGATVVPQFSIDGVNYFGINAGSSSPLSGNISNTGGNWAWKLVDVPIQFMRLMVNVPAGTVTAVVSSF
jgi:hypothetical protein